MHANEPEMADKWEKEESIREKLRNLIKQEIKSINEGFDKYYLSSLLDSKLKKKLEIAIKNLKGKIDGVGDDWIWFRMPSHNLDLLAQLITKLDRNKNVWIGDKRKNNIWDRRQKINKLEATTTSAVPPHDTPMAFKKSTQKAIDTDDEDDEKNESINEGEAKPKKGDYVKTIFGIARIEKLRGSIAYMKLPNKKTMGIWLNDIKNLKPTDEKEKGKTLWTESINEDNIKFSKEEMAQLHKDGKIEKGGHTIEFGESINESDLGLTYKKGKTVKVTHKKSGKELVIIDKPNVKREYEKIGYFAEGEVNEAIKPQGYSQLNRAARTLPSDIKDFLKALKKQDDDAVEREILYLKAEFDTFAHMLKDKKYTESVNEAMTMAPFSSQEAKQHINQDIKKMSKHLGKASQQSIKIMMDGVKGGKYTAMDISRGIKEGPAGRTHFGELGFLQQLWNKVRDGFRRYSKDRKLS